MVRCGQTFRLVIYLPLLTILVGSQTLSNHFLQLVAKCVPVKTEWGSGGLKSLFTGLWWEIVIEMHGFDHKRWSKLGRPSLPTRLILNHLSESRGGVEKSAIS
jgi:hypothetical protein